MMTPLEEFFQLTTAAALHYYQEDMDFYHTTDIDDWGNDWAADNENEDENF